MARSNSESITNTKSFAKDAVYAPKWAAWLCRICFAIVFVVNVHCALGYVISPSDFAGGFQLSGVEGAVAVQGIGIAFLMWNATYPLFIVSPQRFRVLGFVVLAQQIIGLVGESVIYLNLPAGFTQLAESINRFIAFDAFGLVIMAISFIMLLLCISRSNREHLKA